VDHLSDIAFLDSNNARIPLSWRRSLLEIGKSADSLKLEGNIFTGKGEYWRAIQK
jgi:hypothetical protein